MAVRAHMGAPIGCIDGSSTRSLFAELLAHSLRETGTRPSPMAVSYLLDLLEAQVGSPVRAAPPVGEEPGLAWSLLDAHRERGPERVRRLRALGDRALFVAGVFGESLGSKLLDVSHYESIGSAAYGEVAAELDRTGTRLGWRELFRELADDFLAFVDVLAEVGEQTRLPKPPDVLRTYDRYLATGSERDRRRLLEVGLVPLARGSLTRSWQ